MSQTKPSLFYHYTTLEGCEGIVKDKKFYATHAQFTNDSTETTVVSYLLQKRIFQRHKNENGPNNNLRLFHLYRLLNSNLT